MRAEHALLLSLIHICSGGAAVLVGFATAALLVVALELFLSKGFDILHICQVLFPALTVVFLSLIHIFRPAR